MIRGFYSGATSLKAQQTAIDIMSNNIANVSSTGFKQKQGRFSDLLYSTVSDGTGENVSEGSGTAVIQAVNDMSSGTPQGTDSPLDFCIEGDGFFAVRDNAGNTFYTRNGSFEGAATLNGRNILTDAYGRAVLDTDGNVIGLDATGNPQGNPGVYNFPNASALRAYGESLYIPTQQSGAAQRADSEVRQGYVEQSNVDLAGQMSGLLQAERAYQLNVKVVQTADSINEMANGLK